MFAELMGAEWLYNCRRAESTLLVPVAFEAAAGQVEYEYPTTLLLRRLD